MIKAESSKDIVSTGADAEARSKLATEVRAALSEMDTDAIVNIFLESRPRRIVHFAGDFKDLVASEQNWQSRSSM